MNRRVGILRWALLFGLLQLALLAAGCGRREAELQKMADCLQCNTIHRPTLDRSFWVDVERSRKTTVRATLLELGASLHNSKVFDSAGNELYFYEVEDPHKLDPQPQKTEEEIAELEKKYHVIRMYGPPPKD